jgi:hypothetical protein
VLSRPEIAIQRLFARSPAENSLFVTWNTSWRRLKDELLLILKKTILQGNISIMRTARPRQKIRIKRKAAGYPALAVYLSNQIFSESVYPGRRIDQFLFPVKNG